MLRGLFIGIDTYRSPVSRLGFAVADAQALGGLFEDTLSGSVARLLDSSATKVAIEAALDDLASADEDDLVVISFSGHGTDDHRLVPIDVDVSDVEGTSLSLDDLAQLLDQIPSKNLLLFLDCCFSGGFGGARVFAPTAARSMLEDRSCLARLVRGSGRVVITASGAGEPALETTDFGHGLLSYFLMEGLQGKGGLSSGSPIPILALFQHVLQSVVDAAAAMHEVQTPTLYGSIEGAPALVPLAPGVQYAAAFPERMRPPATGSWDSLAAYGFSGGVLDVWRRALPTLNDLQVSAINEHGLLDQKSLLVVAPTGSGKTMVGELAALHAVASGGRTVILLPLKALVNEKYEYMSEAYSSVAKTIRATGDVSDEVGDLLNGQYDLAILTYEKFLNLCLGHPHVMRGVSLVVVDEVQTIADSSRGAGLEMLLTLLRAGHGRLRPPQIVALSAVIGGTRGFERWLGGTLLERTDRPVPLSEAVVDVNGHIRRRLPDGSDERLPNFIQPEYYGASTSSKPVIIPLVRRLVSEGKKVIVFRATKPDTVGAATYLANALGLPPATDVADSLPTADGADGSANLRSVLAGGVAFHNADLDADERRVLEAAFRDASSALRVLVATTTVAMGVNTPAEAVIIAGLQHPFGNPYSVAEYKNMAGRAGRMGLSEVGEAFIVGSTVAPDLAWNQYVTGTPETIVSHFVASSTDPQTLALRCLVALRGSAPEPALLDLLNGSFAAWLEIEQGRQGWDQQVLQQAIDGLVNAELLDREPAALLTVTDLGRFAGESGIEVRSVARISSGLRFAPPELTTPDLVLLAQFTLELDALRVPLHRRSSKEQARWPWTLAQLGVDNSLVQSSHIGGGDSLMRQKRAAACLLFMSDTPLAQVEEVLLQHLRDRSAAGPIRSVSARTRDVIDAVVKVAGFRGHTLTAEAHEDDPGLRLELGLPIAMLEVGALLGNRLSRGQYLALLAAGIVTEDALRDLDSAVLESLVGRDGAARIATRLTS